MVSVIRLLSKLALVRETAPSSPNFSAMCLHIAKKLGDEGAKKHSIRDPKEREPPVSFPGKEDRGLSLSLRQSTANIQKNAIECLILRVSSGL